MNFQKPRDEFPKTSRHFSKNLGTFFYPFFLAIISVTPARMAAMPMASWKVKLSPKTNTPMMTAVTGSKAPMMAAGVLPMRLMEIVMKKRESTVGNNANCKPQSHCLGVWRSWKLSPDMAVKITTVRSPKTNIQKVNFTFDIVVFHRFTDMM